MVARALIRAPSAVRSVDGTSTVVPGALMRVGSVRPGIVAAARVLAAGAAGGVLVTAGDVGTGLGVGVGCVPPPPLPPPPPPPELGVTDGDAADAVDEPTPLRAVTVNVYAVPFVSPSTVQLVVAVVHVWAPGDEVTV